MRPSPFAIVRGLWLMLMCCALLVGCAAPSLAPGEQGQLAGKTFVITGASSGIGRGVAERLGMLKANVVISARRENLLQEVATKVWASGGSALVVAGDVSKQDDIERLAAEAIARFGRIDVWINNAGVGALGRFDDVPVEDHARIIDVNLKGVIYGSHTALRQFMSQGDGVLINIGSVESEVPMAYQALYAASKAGVLSLGRSLNEELRLSGMERIRVSTVLPWVTDTPFFVHAANYSGGSPRMAMWDDPQKVVDVILAASLHPREEVSVGWKGKSAYASHQMFPNLTERAAAAVSHKLQMQNAPPARGSDGNLFQPMEQGSGIYGGNRERIRRENAQMK